MKRRWLLLVLTLAILLAGGAFLLLQADNAFERGFRRIEVGMTEEQVEAAIGGRLGVQAVGIRHLDDGDGGFIWVMFDANGRLEEKGYHRPSLLDRLRTWLGW